MHRKFADIAIGSRKKTHAAKKGPDKWWKKSLIQDYRHYSRFLWKTWTQRPNLEKIVSVTNTVAGTPIHFRTARRPIKCYQPIPIIILRNSKNAIVISNAASSDTNTICKKKHANRQLPHWWSDTAPSWHTYIIPAEILIFIWDHPHHSGFCIRSIFAQNTYSA